MTTKTERMIAYCGIVCTECEAYIATKAGDSEKIEEIAKQWSIQYNADIKPEGVWCDGCLTEGRKCAHCSKCEIRACGIQEEVENCAHCVDYPCKTLNGFFELVQNAKTNLDKIAAEIKK